MIDEALHLLLGELTCDLNLLLPLFCTASVRTTCSWNAQMTLFYRICRP